MAPDYPSSNLVKTGIYLRLVWGQCHYQTLYSVDWQCGGGVTNWDFEESVRGQPSQLSRHLHGGTEENKKSTMISSGPGRGLNHTSPECRFNVTDTRSFLVKQMLVWRLWHFTSPQTICLSGIEWQNFFLYGSDIFLTTGSWEFHVSPY
jgi:hypothetical protein